LHVLWQNLNEYADRKAIEVQYLSNAIRKEAQNGKSLRNSRPFETTVLIIASGISKAVDRGRERVGEG